MVSCNTKIEPFPNATKNLKLSSVIKGFNLELMPLPPFYDLISLAIIFLTSETKALLSNVT